jgi:transcriptional regulator with XRE-family HTH domain
MQKGVTMEEMALALGLFTETRDGTKKGQQARLSQYENQPDGPPWDIVVQYADYFGLKGTERFDFFYQAKIVYTKEYIHFESVGRLFESGRTQR